MIRSIAAFFPAVLLAYVLAVIAHTVGVLSAVQSMGVEVAVADAFASIWHDLLGMVGLYLPLIAVALAIAWLVTALLLRWAALPRTALYVLAGFAGIVALHLIMAAVFGLVGVAAARTTVGLTVQALAGAAGAYLFARLSAS